VKVSAMARPRPQLLGRRRDGAGGVDGVCILVVFGAPIGVWFLDGADGEPPACKNPRAAE